MLIGICEILRNCVSFFWGHGLLFHEVSSSQTTTHHSRYHSSGRLIIQRSPTPSGFETKISEGEHPQAYVLDRATTGTDTPPR